MNDDNWTSLQSAGKVPPPSPEVLAHAAQRVEAAHKTRRRIVRRRVLVPVLAAAATAAVIGVVALQQPGTPTAIPATTPTASPTTYPPSTSVGHPNTANSCVAFSLERLAAHPIAFDGTVVSAKPIPRTAGGWSVTFQVHEWFRATGGAQIAVVMWTGPGSKAQRSPREVYDIGDRLLIVAGPMVRGDDPMKLPVTGLGCGFSRVYDEQSARTWRKIFQK